MHPLQERKNYHGLRYGWVITKDLINGGQSNGTMGPHDCCVTADQIKTGGVEFRMLDDDDEIYYHGFFFENNEPESDGFEPLDDFGLPNAGCTDIQYKNKDGQWESQ